MEQALAYLKKLENSHWLIGDGAGEFHQIATELYMRINQEIPPDYSRFAYFFGVRRNATQE
jgi:hypothetical protein